MYIHAMHKLQILSERPFVVFEYNAISKTESRANFGGGFCGIILLSFCFRSLKSYSLKDTTGI